MLSKEERQKRKEEKQKAKALKQLNSITSRIARRLNALIRLDEANQTDISEEMNITDPRIGEHKVSTRFSSHYVRSLKDIGFDISASYGVSGRVLEATIAKGDYTLEQQAALEELGTASAYIEETEADEIEQIKADTRKAVDTINAKAKRVAADDAFDDFISLYNENEGLRARVMKKNKGLKNIMQNAGSSKRHGYDTSEEWDEVTAELRKQMYGV